jgi:hypothetical protein
LSRNQGFYLDLEASKLAINVKVSEFGQTGARTSKGHPPLNLGSAAIDNPTATADAEAET